MYINDAQQQKYAEYAKAQIGQGVGCYADVSPAPLQSTLTGLINGIGEALAFQRSLVESIDIRLNGPSTENKASSSGAPKDLVSAVELIADVIYANNAKLEAISRRLGGE